MLSGLNIRDFRPSDFNFIVATWLHFFKSHSYFAKRIKHSVFFKHHNRLIQSILAKPSTRAIILHESSEPDVILGFFVFEVRDVPVMHFMFIKEELRGMGLGTNMLRYSNVNPDGSEFSHWTYAMNDLVNKYPNLIYNPYRTLL